MSLTLRDVARFVAPLRNRVENMITRGVLRLVDDSKKFQELQVDLIEGETRDQLEHVGRYGFTSVPFPEAETVVVFVGGKRDHGVVVACDDRRYRLVGLEKGEVALYTDEGDKIELKRNNNIVITCKTKVAINCPLVEMSQDLTVDGKLDVTGTTVLRSTLDVKGNVQLEQDLEVDGAGSVRGELDVGGAVVATGEVTGNGKHLSTHTHSVPAAGLAAPSGGGSVTGTATSAAPS